jgi:PHD finger-like domain-containing protein 5A
LFGLPKGSDLRSFGVVQREGCPKIVNLGSSKTDLFYERKKYGFKKR